MWYLIGKYKGVAFVRKFGKYVGLNDEKIERGRELFNTHGIKILLGAKLTNGFGIIIAILFVSGMYRIDFKKYLAMNFIGEIIWSGVLLGVGYFFGNLYNQIDNVFYKMGLIGLCIVAVVVIFNIITFHVKKRV
jgi:membrane protein DedA with SNARE-associated domain